MDKITQEEIDQLKQRNAELVAQLVEVNNNRTGVAPCARFCEALASKKMFDNLQTRNAELMAQVEHCKALAISNSNVANENAIRADKAGIENQKLRAQVEILRHAGVALRKPWDLNKILGGETRRLVLAWDDALAKTPAQCLAEHDREVAARAGRDGFIAGFDKCWYSVYGTNSPDFTVPALAEQYVNKIKSGEVDV